MSDEIETMVHVGAVWHGLGVNVEEELTAADAHRLAGLDWICEKKNMVVETDELELLSNTSRKVPVPGKSAVMRMSDHKVLGVVGSRYEVIQNAACFDFMDSLIGTHGAVYHTAGSLFGGRIVFMTVKLPTEMQIGPDKVEQYLLLTNSHDGSGALHVRWTPVRVVCANTLNMALDANSKCKCSIRHTGNYEDKVREARQLLEMTELYFLNAAQNFTEMVNVNFSDERMEEYIELLYPATVTTKGDIKVSSRTTKIRETVLQLSHTGMGIAPIKNTKWGALNAVAEYIDHRATRRITGENDPQESRMHSVMIGAGAETKQKAYNILQEM